MRKMFVSVPGLNPVAVNKSSKRRGKNLLSMYRWVGYCLMKSWQDQDWDSVGEYSRQFDMLKQILIER